MVDNEPERSAKATALCRAVTLIWVAVLGVQFTVWVLMCLISGHFAAAAWWLWSGAAGGLVVSALWLLTQRRRHVETT